MTARHHSRWWVTLLLTVLLSGGASAVASAPTNATPELGFPVGEEAIFKITWGIIPVGWARVHSEWIEQNGERLLRIRHRVRTNAFFRKFYPMNDTAESIIDPVTFLPRTFSFARERRRVLCDDVVTFHHEAGLAVIRSRCDLTEKLIDIEPDTRDILTFMYYHRLHPPSPHSKEQHRVMTPDGLLDLTLAFRGYETIKLPTYGKVKSLVVEPEMNYAGILIEGGKVKMWISDDERCMTLRLDIHAPLADTRAILCGISGPGDDRWVTEAPGTCQDPDAVSAEAGPE